jgi:hypothetical protein
MMTRLHSFFASRSPEVHLLWLTWGVLLAVTAYAVCTDYFYFSDSSFFLFAILSDLTLDGVWLQFPKRIGAFLLTQGPLAALAQVHAGLTVTQAKLIYAMSFMGLPLLGLAWARYLNRDKGFALAAVAMVGLNYFATFAFPTETCVTIALLVVLLATLSTSRASVSRPIVLAVLPPFFVLSHEAALLTLPAMAYVAHRACRRGTLSLLEIRLWVGSTAVGLLAWIGIKLGLPPSNTMVAQALVQNSQAIFHFGRTIARPLPALSFFGVLVPLLLLIQDEKKQRWVWRVGLVLLVFLLLRAWRIDAVGDRYISRTVVVWLAPIMPLLPLWLTQAGRRTVMFMSMTLLIVAAVHVRSIGQWRLYAHHVVSLVHGQHDEQWAELNAKQVRRMQSFQWGWTDPYLAALLTDKGSRQSLPLDEGWYSPLTCATLTRADSSLQTLLTADELGQLRPHLCQKFAALTKHPK